MKKAFDHWQFLALFIPLLISIGFGIKDCGAVEARVLKCEEQCVKIDNEMNVFERDITDEIKCLTSELSTLNGNFKWLEGYLKSKGVQSLVIE